jgi:hypothetical protein
MPLAGAGREPRAPHARAEVPVTGVRDRGATAQQRGDPLSIVRRALLLGRTPIGGVLVIALLLRLTGLTWGLPASDGWDDDGVAPRDFLVGALFTYWSGHHYTYPPLQLVILTVVSAPIWTIALLRAPSLSQDSVIGSFIQVPTMTALAMVARATTVTLSLGLLWNVAKIGEDLGGSKRAGAWTAAACAANVVFTYYSQTSNLDVPYLFWAVLALREFVHSMVHGGPFRLRRVPVLAALAVATKDQAYALFLLGIPLATAAWLVIDRDARLRRWEILQKLTVGSALGVALLLIVDGAVVNSSGFAARISLLLGAASQDHAYYATSWTGRLHAAYDSVFAFDQYFPWVFAPFVLVGMILALREPNRARRAAGLVPLFFAVSFTVAFNMTARRTEHRFLLPQMMMWSLYAGRAFDALHARLGALSGWRAWLPWLVAVPCFSSALFRCAAVDVAMVFDPRYDSERWMHAHVRNGDQIEVYGNNVHLPRLPSGAVVERVDPAPLGGRNPLPGVVEVSDRFSDVEARRPLFIVVSEFWATKYLTDAAVMETGGHILSPEEAKLRADVDSRTYFRALRDGRLGYRLAHLSRWDSPVWPRVDIHESLTRDIWIFERKESLR